LGASDTLTKPFGLPPPTVLKRSSNKIQ